jgi:hypothetical protein
MDAPVLRKVGSYIFSCFVCREIMFKERSGGLSKVIIIIIIIIIINTHNMKPANDAIKFFTFLFTSFSLLVACKQPT